MTGRREAAAAVRRGGVRAEKRRQEKEARAMYEAPFARRQDTLKQWSLLV